MQIGIVIDILAIVDGHQHIYRNLKLNLCLYMWRTA